MARSKELQNLEDEVRQKLGISQVGPNMTTKEAGKLGGNMVKELINRGKQQR